MIVIEKHRSLLRQLGLATVEGFKSIEAEMVEGASGKRDVLRIRAKDAASRDFVLFLKRHWSSRKLAGLASLLRHGRVRSSARREWENAKRLRRAGFETAALVAFAEDCGPVHERFSGLLTEAATGSHTVEQFLRERTDARQRRRVFDALAREVRRLHEAHLSLPDLFTRHVWFDPDDPVPTFCFIDIERLDQGRSVTGAARVRTLAALNVSAPLRFMSVRERLRFLRVYAGHPDRRLIERIKKRTDYLLRRKRYRDYLAPRKRA